jgi:hypothetical protein
MPVSTRLREFIRSNVMGILALFVALGGTAYATHPDGADTISSADIVNNQVMSADLRDNDVRSVDVRDDTSLNGGLAAQDLGPGSVGASELAADAVPANGRSLGDGSTKVADNAIGVFEIAPAAVAGSEVRNNSLTGDDVDESTLYNDDSLTGADIDETTLAGRPLRGGDTIDASPRGEPLGETATLIANDALAVRGVCFQDIAFPGAPTETFMAVRLIGSNDTYYATNSAFSTDQSIDENGTFSGSVTLPESFDSLATRFEMMATFGGALVGQIVGRVNDGGSCTFFAAGMG